MSIVLPYSGERCSLERPPAELWTSRERKWAGRDVERWRLLAILHLVRHCGWTESMIARAFGPQPATVALDALQERRKLSARKRRRVKPNEFWRQISTAYGAGDGHHRRRQWQSLAMLILKLHCRWSQTMIGYAFGGMHRGHVGRKIRECVWRLRDDLVRSPRENQLRLFDTESIG